MILSGVKVGVQGLNNYTLGSLAADNVAAPFEWRTELFTPVDMMALHDPIETQNYNMCVGEALTTIAETLLKDRTGTQYEFSELFSYTDSRLAGGQPLSDNGTSAFTAMSQATKNGICMDAMWPQWSPVNDVPNPAAYADAAQHLCGRYERLGAYGRSLTADLKACAAQRLPAVVCIPLTEAAFNVSGSLPSHPTQGGTTYIGAPDYIGAHAITFIGWTIGNYGQELAICQNSWGAEWGFNGYWAIPFSILEGRAFDCFAMRSFSGVDGGEFPFEWRRWTSYCTLRDGSFISISTSGIPAQIYRLYQAAFARKPDYSGLSFWIDSGQSLSAISDTFVASAEFQNLYGFLNNTDFIKQLYRNVLGREGDTDGITFWVNVLDMGYGRGYVLLQFSESPENQNNVNPTISMGIHYQ